MTAALSPAARSLGVALLLAVAACDDAGEPAGRGPAQTATTSPSPSPSSTALDTPSPSPSETALPSSTATSTPTATNTATRTPPDPLSGGATTVFNVSRNAFALPAANLDAERESDFFVGNAIFNRSWVTAPSSTEGSDGVGPVFNARSCSACHFHDGRGRPPASDDDEDPSLLFRLSLPGASPQGGPLPDPHYGDQLGPRAILGVLPEGRMHIRYEEVTLELADGERVQLRRPSYQPADLAFGPLPAEILVSPRVAPFLVGLGLLAAVDEQTVLAGADETDLDGDGISGRPNRVWHRRQARIALGRFGWKANQPDLEQQNAGAFLGDIGITSDIFPEESCTPVQAACLEAPNGGAPEVDSVKLDFVTFYTHTLGVPARRDLGDPTALLGESLFSSSGCVSCHLPALRTGTLDGFPELSQQLIHPYTDLLLHDMGPELADDRPDFAADGHEWRTPPLWGIGLVETVNRHTNFLHDGRARSLLEAILWHGGEAEAAREAFRQLSRQEREAVVSFLESL